MGNCQAYSQEDLANITQNQKGRLQLMVKTDTWLRDSYGLFDYENTNISSNQFKSYTSGRIIRTGTKIRFLKENESVSNNEETKELIKVDYKEGTFWIGASESNKAIEDRQDPIVEETEKIESSPWLVIKSIKGKTNNKGYQLEEGDLIKLGRVKVKVVELRKPGKQLPRGPDIEIAKRSATEPESLGDEDLNDDMMDRSIYAKEITGHVCRICLSEGSESGNPLFDPCKCSGTMKYVHIKCLQTWLKSKLYIKDLPQVLSYYLKSFECELCKTLFPNIFEIGNTKYGIIEIERPKTPYILLEILSKDGNVLRGLHLVRMDKKNSIRLGRGHDSDIRISDISVSRFHALIKMEKDGFYIEDNNSKFGTLALMKKPLAIVGNENVFIQVGRTVASFSLKRSWRPFANYSKNTTEVQTEGLAQPKLDTIEQMPETTETKATNIIEIRERPIVINRRSTGFGARSERGSLGPQRPLGGDDDVVELEDGIENQRREDVSEESDEEREEEINEDIVVRDM